MCFISARLLRFEVEVNLPRHLFPLPRTLNDSKQTYMCLGKGMIMPEGSSQPAEVWVLEIAG